MRYACRRFAEDEEDEADARGEREQQEEPPEQGPPLELEAPLVRGPDFSSIRLVRVSLVPQALCF